MISYIANNRSGMLFLLGSMLFTAAYWTWVMTDTEGDNMRKLASVHNVLTLQQKFDKADQLIINSLKEYKKEKLPRHWLPMVRRITNGYKRFQYYPRLIAGTPDDEDIYEEISNLIDIAPDEFKREVKPIFISDINSIPGVNKEYLKKYQLINESSTEN